MDVNEQLASKKNGETRLCDGGQLENEDDENINGCAKKKHQSTDVTTNRCIGTPKQRQKLPIDRGWAWVILLASFGEFFLIVGSIKSFGLFFVEFLQTFNTTASMVSIALSIQTAVFSFAAFGVLTVGTKRLSNRQLIMTGGFFAALGYFLISFSHTVTFLVLSYGFLNGIGYAFSYGPSIVLLSTYFEKRRGLANSLANVGGSTGSLVIPLIVRYLLDTYGLRGTLMIISGMLLNITALGSLMRPLPSHVADENTQFSMHEIDIVVTTETNDGNCALDKVKEHYLDEDNDDSKHVLIERLRNQTSIRSDCSEVVNGNSMKNAWSSNMSLNRVLDKLNSSKSELTGSMANLASPVSVMNISKSSSVNRINKTEKRFRCSNIINISILKNHIFQILMCAGFLCVFGSALAITFIPPFAKDENIPDNEIALLITIAAISDFVGRFSVAWIADGGFIRRYFLVGICMLISALAAMCNQFYSSFASFAVYAIIYGIFGGVYFSLYPLLIADAVGQQNLTDGFAICFIVHGTSLMMNSFILGYIRDVTGSYHASFYMMGAGMLLGTLCLFCEPIARKLEESRQKRISQ